MQRLRTLWIGMAAAGIAVGCSSESGRTVLVPTDVPTTHVVAAQNAPSLLGTWTQTSTVGSRTIGSLPTPNSCSAFQFTMTSQTATQATGSFTASCPGDLTLTGTITG